MAKYCALKCLGSPEINLPHNTEVIIGRSKETRIVDLSCSRKQISLKANYDNYTVEVKQVGVNPSGIDGFAMIKDKLYTVQNGSRIEILFNKYYYTVKFHPSSDAGVEPNNKRKSDEALVLGDAKIMKMDENYEDKGAEEDSWDNVHKGELYVYTSKGVKASEKVAAFDMDGTIIKTKSNKIHPVDTNDWQIIFREVPKKLKEQLEKGFKIIFFTNQASIGNGKTKIEDFKNKITNIVDVLQVPVQVFISTGKGFYRKPASGMWKIFSEQKNNGVVIDMKESFYCGDAAGRAAKWAPGKKKDHSFADILFAENIGLRFFTPEQYFLGHSISNVPFLKPEFNPKDITSETFDDRLISKEKEMLVLVGFPGSGKSFLAKQIELKSNNKYVAVCRDKLGSWQKCYVAAERLLRQGKSVIVDNTNPDIESRARWVELAQKENIECRCVKMTTSFAHARHNNKYREIMKMAHVPVNDVVFFTYRNKFKDPELKEGFKEVIEAKFNPIFEDKRSENLYKMHLLEK